MMKSADIKKLLEQYGIRPLRGRSQNFLLDEAVVAAMVGAADVGPGSSVVEIGPGPGILTEMLLRSGAEVVAVEIDQKLCRLLRQRFSGPAFHLIESDILETANVRLAGSFAGPARRSGAYVVVANLPYAITTLILEKFFFEEPRPASLTIMVQREVADRILAAPGDMSSLAVMVQSLGRPRRVLDVPRTAFLPAPRVDSTVIHIDLKKADEMSSFFGSVPADKFFAVVRRAFSQRRKQLKNTLKNFCSDPKMLENAMFKAKINPSSRPEELAPKDWVALAAALNQ